MPDISQLLLRGESASLDFKRDQYAFTDDQTKGELLKDILAMANAWRNEVAFILIGVDDSQSPPAVAGIPVQDHFDDATLQQFVNGKTQQPLTFAYYTAELQGKSVGVIEIPQQRRPLHLKKDFGGLKANTVYLRRGSATSIALPEEIAKMGASALHLGSGDLVVQFALPNDRKGTGSSLTFECTNLKAPKSVTGLTFLYHR